VSMEESGGSGQDVHEIADAYAGLRREGTLLVGDEEHTHRVDRGVAEPHPEALRPQSATAKAGGSEITRSKTESAGWNGKPSRV